MISIVMPTHKKVPMMYATLISVFSQNNNDFEFIVVDASKDNYFENEIKTLFESNRILKRYTNKLDKLKIIHPERDRNFPGAMKMEGFKNCIQDDDFVVFLDHDDFLGPDLLNYILKVKIQYPNTEMVTTKYTSMVYDNGQLHTNLKTYAGGTVCGSTDTIYIGDIYFKFNINQDIYENKHPFKSVVHPQILSKKVLRENRFTFITDTERMDDYIWPTMTHALVETYVPIIGYVYMAYGENDASNSCLSERIVSDKAKTYRKICDTYENMLTEIGYVKPRNILVV